MQRRSRFAVFREHRRSAPREALDPGEGEAMLGQAGTARPQPAPRFSAGRDCCVSSAVGITSAATFCPRAELLIFPECWRRARVEFSPSPDAYPNIFHPRLELLSFSRGLASRVADFSRVLAAYPCGIFTKPQRLSRHFPPAPRVVDFSRRLAARPCEIFT